MRRRAALLALLLGAIPAASLPQVPDGKWWKRPRVAQELALTAEQSEKIEKIFVKARPRLIDLKGDLEKRQLDLQVAMDDKSSSRADVEQKIDAVENARKELQKARAMMILDMKQVLTPDQWKRLMQMREEARTRRRQARSDPSGQRRP